MLHVPSAQCPVPRTQNPVPSAQRPACMQPSVRKSSEPRRSSTVIRPQDAAAAAGSRQCPATLATGPASSPVPHLDVHLRHLQRQALQAVVLRHAHHCSGPVAPHRHVSSHLLRLLLTQAGRRQPARPEPRRPRRPCAAPAAACAPALCAACGAPALAAHLQAGRPGQGEDLMMSGACNAMQCNAMPGQARPGQWQLVPAGQGWLRLLSAAAAGSAHSQSPSGAGCLLAAHAQPPLVHSSCQQAG